MYELTVETTFCAAHAIVIRGEREPVHGHNWHVSVTVSGETLDADGLLVDFHEVEGALRGAVQPFHNRDLNATAPFDRINPTAELVARHIAERVSGALGRPVDAVRLTEAPGCAVVYRPNTRAAGGSRGADDAGRGGGQRAERVSPTKP